MNIFIIILFFFLQSTRECTDIFCGSIIDILKYVYIRIYVSIIERSSYKVCTRIENLPELFMYLYKVEK